MIFDMAAPLPQLHLNWLTVILQTWGEHACGESNGVPPLLPPGRASQVCTHFPFTWGVGDVRGKSKKHQ
jgi:hypothetical protein